jgi:hypothetical protein
MSATTKLLEADPSGVRQHRNPDDWTAFAGRCPRRLGRACDADARPAALETVVGDNGRGRDRGAL